jgi:hypothetical protein
MKRNTLGLVIILVLLLIVIMTTKKEAFNFNSHVNFLTKDQTIDFLLNDPDNYHQNMSKYDLIAQKAPNYNYVIQRAVSVAGDFTPAQKQIIEHLTQKVDDWFRNSLNIKYIDGHKLAEIPWNFGLTHGNVYENGYPHTRKDIIFITDNIIKNTKQFAVTLAHEKVHVFERMYPEDMNVWMENNGYELYATLKDFPLARSNPDIDNIVYLSPDKFPTVAIYNSTNPRGIFDAYYPGRPTDDPSYEHPNETLAYKIDKMFNDEYDMYLS